jgi:hypothetical protein
MNILNRFRLLSLAFFCLFALQAHSQTSAFSENQKILIREALRTAVSTEKNLPNYQDLRNKKKIVLLDKMVSMDNPDAPPVYLTKEMLPEFENVKFELQTEAEIKNKKRRKDLLFLRLTQLPDPDSNYGLAHVLSQYQLGKKSHKKGVTFRETRGYTLLFKKTDGSWKFEKVVNSFLNVLEVKESF